MELADLGLGIAQVCLSSCVVDAVGRNLSTGSTEQRFRLLSQWCFVGMTLEPEE